MRNYIEERFPEEFAKSLITLNSIQEEAWEILKEATDTKEKIQALTVAQECSIKKMQLLTNPAIIDNAKRFVANSQGLSAGPIQQDRIHQ